jgi:hypothetical protein
MYPAMTGLLHVLVEQLDIPIITLLRLSAFRVLSWFFQEADFMNPNQIGTIIINFDGTMENNGTMKDLISDGVIFGIEFKFLSPSSSHPA